MQLPRGLIIILGSPNDSRGNLCEMGKARLQAGHERYLFFRSREFKILLTGGYGAHFNTTEQPHAYYAREYLCTLGVPGDAILEFAESCNTVDDALQSRPIVERHGAHTLCVVSSDFHMERVRFIFERVFPDKELLFHESPYLHRCSSEEQFRLREHEANELHSLRERGESIVGGALRLDAWRTGPNPLRDEPSLRPGKE